MKTLIAVIVLLAIVVSAITYIVKEKKKGVRCIGCPYAGSCERCQISEEDVQHIRNVIETGKSK